MEVLAVVVVDADAGVVGEAIAMVVAVVAGVAVAALLAQTKKFGSPSPSLVVW